MELINRAWYLSGIVARDLEQVDGSDGQDGLFWFNQLLSEISVPGEFLPYVAHDQFVTVAGQESYFVEGLAILESITFNETNVRYSMLYKTRREFFATPRANNVQSLPVSYYWERVNGGVQVYLYFAPNKVYTMDVTGWNTLPSLTNDDELNDTFDKFYQSFLMYKLADRLCQWKQITLPASVQMQLNAFIEKMQYLNPLDLSISKTSTLDKTPAFSYAQVNIGKGWTSP